RTYTIRASYVGYSTETIKDIALSKNDSLFFTIEMKVSSVFTEEIVVQDSKPLIEKSATNSLKIIDSERIERIHFEVGGYEAKYGNKDIRYPSDALNTEEYGLIVT